MLKKKSTIGGFNKTTKGKRPLVHQRESEWDLNRFLPTIHHLALAVDAGTLNPMEYPSLGGESEAPATMSAGGSPVKPGHVGGGMGAKTPGKSARSRPGGGGVQMANRGSSFGGDHEAPRFDRAGSSSDLQNSDRLGRISPRAQAHGVQPQQRGRRARTAADRVRRRWRDAGGGA